MATKDKDGKLTYQMISPGDALNNFVNSKEGHNAAAVTPEYLKPMDKDSAISKAITERQKQQEMEKTEIIKQDMQQKKDKNIDRDRG